MTKFRTVGPARTVGPSFSMAGRRRTRDQEDPDTIEIHNHIPEGDNQRDEEEGDKDGVIARYPSTYHVRTEGKEIVVYSRLPRQGGDMSAAESNLAFDHVRTQDHQPPRTLAQLNRYFNGYYGRRKKTAAR